MTRTRQDLPRSARRWPVRSYASFDEMLGDTSVEMVLNLTSPRSHFEVSARCLEAGKHVYSEKPLGMDFQEASKLVALADQNELYLASAPCSLLSQTAQTVWKAIKDGAVGKIRLVYANFDDGMIAPKLAPWTWINDCGVPWPAKDEFEVGCTYIHAGYVLTWLAAFFGPAKTVTSFSSCQIPDKGIFVDGMAPDFSVGCIEYDDGIVARVTCGLVAPRDKSLTIIGDDGIIYTSTVRNDRGAGLCSAYPCTREAEQHRAADESGPPMVALAFAFHARQSEKSGTLNGSIRPPANRRRIVVADNKPVDFNRGPAELAEAIRQQRPCRLSGKLGIAHCGDYRSASVPRALWRQAQN